MPPTSWPPAVRAAVEEYMQSLTETPAVTLDQEAAELVLSDVIEQLAGRAAADEWDWVACFCEIGGLHDIFAIFEHAGGQDTHRGLLVRGLLAFEAVGVALGNAAVLDVVCRTPSIVRLFVLKFDAMPSRLTCAALRTLAVVALHNMSGHVAAIAAIHGKSHSPTWRPGRAWHAALGGPG